MDFKKSYEEIQKILDILIEENKKVPVIVEGEKDILALRRLGLIGEIITLNRGVNLIDFSDKIAERYKSIIILTDWDRRGGFLCHTILRNLKGRVNCNTYFRESLAKLTTIKTVESLPSWILTMSSKHNSSSKVV